MYHQEKYKDRIEKSKEKLTKAFKLEKVDEFPVITCTKPYFLIGSDPKKIPEDYYVNPKSMMKYQLKGIERHMEKVNDDTIPYFMPWFGTGVLASAFGAGIKFSYKKDPVVCSKALNDIKDIKNLKIPDPEKDGLMPKVLEFINFMKDNQYGIPVSITNIQSPLDTIGLMCGHQNLYLWMHDDPAVIKELFDIVTETLILWVKKQKEIIGLKLDEANGLQHMWTPKGVGIWMSEDDDVMISPDIWAEFVKEPVDRILTIFGSGFLHYCGSADHNLDNYSKLKRLSGFNNWTLNDLNSAYRLKEKVCKDKCLMICDFTPVNIKEYYQEIIDNFNPTGIIILSMVTEKVAAAKGGAITTDRNDIETANQVLDVFKFYKKYK